MFSCSGTIKEPLCDVHGVRDTEIKKESHMFSLVQLYILTQETVRGVKLPKLYGKMLQRQYNSNSIEIRF
jgi:hypothetical protein